VIGEVVARLRHEAGHQVRAAISGHEALDQADLATVDDPGLFGPGSVAWKVHGDSAMLIGGLRALLLQTLHPLTMAGVADHSDYRNDPWGRLHRTGRFIGATTYGNSQTAEQVIAAVRAVHDRIVGTAPDGRPYSANDPHLLLWVHATEVDSFLASYDRYGTGRLTNVDRDRYVAEMAEVGRRLGIPDPPTGRAALGRQLDLFRHECCAGRQARDAVRFLLMPPVPLVLRGTYGVVAAAAVGLLPGWARRQLWLPLPPGLDPLVIRPPAAVLTRTVGWLLGASTARDRAVRSQPA
jgi:uncharacterized protein (DUF2236 family)